MNQSCRDIGSKIERFLLGIYSGQFIFAGVKLTYETGGRLMVSLLISLEESLSGCSAVRLMRGISFGDCQSMVADEEKSILRILKSYLYVSLVFQIFHKNGYHATDIGKNNCKYEIRNFCDFFLFKFFIQFNSKNTERVLSRILPDAQYLQYPASYISFYMTR